MTLLQKKCFVAVCGLHGLLVLILFVGPAFRSEPKVEAVTPLTIIPANLIDGPTTGGSPEPTPAQTPAQPAQTPAAAPAPAVEKPQPKPVEAPKPVVEPVKPQPPEPEKVETPEPDPPQPATHPIIHTPKPVKHTVHNPPVVKRNSDIKIDWTVDSSADEKKKAADDARAAARAAAKAEAKRLKQIQAAFGNATGELTSNIGNRTEGVGKLVQVSPGSGGGGPASANYRDAIFSIYYNAWTPPDNVNDAHSETEAKVVVARDGSIISATVTSRSGQTGLDKSVERTLKKVMQLPPFPASATDDRRTFIIIFNLKAKLEG